MAPLFTANWFNFGRNSASGPSGPTAPFSATGGTTDTGSRSGWTLHVFTSPGNLVCTGVPKSYEIFIIGGGGSGGTSEIGGSSGGGGGGAGCLKYLQPTTDLSYGTHAVTVGEGAVGGVPGTNNGLGNDGADSVFSFSSDPVTSPGGGAGGGSSSTSANNEGRAGGSSGGSGNQSGVAAGSEACEGANPHPGNADVVSPAEGWGNIGGNITPPGTGPSYSGAGGGGAVNAGTNGTTAPASGVGGSGARFSFLPPNIGTPGPSPTHRYVAGGGGGSSYDSTRNGADGGTGGGGHGGSGGTNDAPFNASGHGAGGGGSAQAQQAGNGTDGCVIIMYED